MDLQNKLAVVTGATEGIGRATALALGKAGARVAICARTEKNVRATVDALKEHGVDAVGAPCDVADPKAVTAFAAYVSKERGDAAVLVNNAGIGRFARLEDLSLEDWDAVMGTNVRSLYLVTRAFLPALLRTKGAVVNLASLAGRNGIEGGTAYCASKHAALGFSKALMLEVRKQGVRVVAICPGSVATPFMDKQDRPGRTARDRMLHAEDVAEAGLATLVLPDRALISELDLRPANPG